MKSSALGLALKQEAKCNSEIAYCALLYEVSVGTLISLPNAYAGCGRPTLNFIERFWLRSLRSAFMLTHMN